VGEPESVTRRSELAAERGRLVCGKRVRSAVADSVGPGRGSPEPEGTDRE
jgi:hypothetical protein